jgi:hypothetical protein
MTDSALTYLNKSGGWAIGTGPSIVVLDQGAARSLTTTNLRSDVYAFVFQPTGSDGWHWPRGFENHQDHSE